MEQKIKKRKEFIDSKHVNINCNNLIKLFAEDYLKSL